MATLSAPWLDNPASRAVTDMLCDAGYQAYFVGGCVRNALIGAPVSDLDLSTDAHPERVMELAKAAGLRAVPTGFDHGTVTVVSNGTPYEITTYRRDVETDGRHAVVAYAKTLQEDALRRDFTMNALYVGRDGTVLDPINGLPDLNARRVRFIEDPHRRIEEDRLRILRFFRFSAWYGGNAIDPEGLAACAALAEGVGDLARERVGQEFGKLLKAPDPSVALAAMAQSGVLARILPGADATPMARLVHNEGLSDVAPNRMARLALICQTAPRDELRLSNSQLAMFTRLREAIALAGEPDVLGYRLGGIMAELGLLLAAALAGQEPDPKAIARAKQAAEQQIPIKAQDLMPKYRGAALGARLAELEARWIDSGFALSRDELLRFP